MPIGRKSALNAARAEIMMILRLFDSVLSASPSRDLSKTEAALLTAKVMKKFVGGNRSQIAAAVRRYLLASGEAARRREYISQRDHLTEHHLDLAQHVHKRKEASGDDR